MKMKILHLEDNEKKHAIIQAVLEKMLDAEIDWVTDVASGITKIEEAIDTNTPYDVAITDMHYPLSKGLKADWEAGSFFVDVINRKGIDLPVIVCSSQKDCGQGAFGYVWYDATNDWRKEFYDLLIEIARRKEEQE